METPADNVPQLAETSKRLAQRALVICENRIELLLVEVQQERERILRSTVAHPLSIVANPSVTTQQGPRGQSVGRNHDLGHSIAMSVATTADGYAPVPG